MTITVYRSTDASAPTLNGLSGSLVTILDACLVDGYGSQPDSGWAKEFSGSGKAVYRAAAGNRHRVRVDDGNGPTARVIGYEVMTTVDAGTGPFPTEWQQPGGLYVNKSGSADSVTRPWLLIANDRAFYFFSFANQQTFGLTSSADGAFFFGDLLSHKVGDAYGTLIAAHIQSGSGQSYFGESGHGIGAWTAINGHFVARSFTQFGGSVPASKCAPRILPESSGSHLGANTYSTNPNPVTGDVDLSAIHCTELTNSATATWATRGRIPGLWEPAGYLIGKHLDLINGSGDLSGRQFILLQIYRTGNPARVAIQISGNWS